MERLARRQYGHVTRRQLLDLGLHRALIESRLRSGRLVAVHAGVYAVGLPRDDALARAAAAVLACGSDALLSHWSAAALWDLGTGWRLPIHVTLASGDRRTPGVVVHRSRTLTRADRRRRLGIWVTSVPRTLLEIAPRCEDRRLQRIANDALVTGLLRRSALAELLERCPGHPGARQLRPFIAAFRGPTKSELEDAFVAFVARYGLPEPRLNARVAGYERDAVFERERVIVELDGWASHRGRAAFETDRERDAAALREGWVTVRITWERLHGAPEVEAARLLEILASRGARGELPPAS